MDSKHTLQFNVGPNASELVHKYFSEVLRDVVEENQDSWNRYISEIALAFSSKQRRANLHFFMFGWPPRIELDILENDSGIGNTEDEYVSQTLKRACRAFDLVPN